MFLKKDWNNPYEDFKVVIFVTHENSKKQEPMLSKFSIYPLK